MTAQVGLALTIGLLFGVGAYLMLERSLVRILFGLVLISNAANLVIFLAGGLTWGKPAIVPPGAQGLNENVANALPQALVLTAIVIGFGLIAFALILAERAYRALGTTDTEAMRAAEPVEGTSAETDPPTAPRQAA